MAEERVVELTAQIAALERECERLRKVLRAIAADSPDLLTVVIAREALSEEGA